VRGVRLALGMPRRGSSPAVQQHDDLNEDRTLRPKRSSASAADRARRRDH